MLNYLTVKHLLSQNLYIADFISQNILLHLSDSIRFFASSSVYLSMGFASSNSVATTFKECIITNNKVQIKRAHPHCLMHFDIILQILWARTTWIQPCAHFHVGRKRLTGWTVAPIMPMTKQPINSAGPEITFRF